VSMRQIENPRIARFFRFVDEVCTKDSTSSVFATDMLKAYNEWCLINNIDRPTDVPTMILIKESFQCEAVLVGRTKRILITGITVDSAKLAAIKAESASISKLATAPIQPALSAQATLTVDEPTLLNLSTLIDRILQRQERRTPGYVLRSQAMQRILVRLDTALEGDDTTLRAEVAAVIHDLGDVIQWEG
jgi:hypothetical protein